MPTPSVRVVVKLPYNRPDDAPNDPPKVCACLCVVGVDTTTDARMPPDCVEPGKGGYSVEGH